MSDYSKLFLSPQWLKEYHTKYPHGLSVMENLIEWVNQVNELIDYVNAGPDHVAEVLLAMELDGRLSDLINIQKLNDKADKVFVDVIETQVSNLISQVHNKVDQNVFNEVVANLGNGSPKGVFDNLAALQTAYPSGTPGIYITTDNGNWYYWKNAWISGGIYQGTSITNSSITGEKLSDQYSFKRILTSDDDLNNIFESGVYYWNGDVSSPAHQPLPLNGSAILEVSKAVGVYTIQKVYDANAPHASYTRKIETNPTGNTYWIPVWEVANRYIAYIGDSISVSGVYQNVIKNELDAYIHNYSEGGAAVVLYEEGNPFNQYSFVGRSESIPLPSYLNHIFVFMGTNDFGNSVALGSRGSENPREFKGAIRTGIKKILERRPDMKIAFAAPMFRATVSDVTYQDIVTTPNGAGLYLSDYINAMIETCNDLGIPVFNTFAEAGINKYNYVSYMSDLIHPNDAGQKRLGYIFSKFIKQKF